MLAPIDEYLVHKIISILNSGKYDLEILRNIINEEIIGYFDMKLKLKKEVLDTTNKILNWWKNYTKK